MSQTNTAEPHYEFDRFGELRFNNRTDSRHHGREDLAITYAAEDGVLYKHGPEAGVRVHYEMLRKVDPSAELIVIPMEALRGEKGSEILAEINACLTCSGRVARLAERLQAI